MNNLIILVGKVSSINSSSNSFTLKVERTNKDNLQIDTDSFVCETWKGMYSYLSSYVNIDDIILVKGKLVKESEKFIVKIDEFSIIQRLNKKISA